MKRYLLLALLLSLSPISFTFANDKIKILKVGMAGNGCPEETESLNKTLIRKSDTSVRIISPFFVLPGKPPHRTFIRYKCDVGVGVEVENGYQVGIKASAKAFIELDSATNSTVTLDAFFAGSRSGSGRKEVKFDTPSYQNFEISNDTTQWSKCGVDSILRMKIAATLRGKDLGESYLRVNSFGMELESRACSEPS